MCVPDTFGPLCHMEQCAHRTGRGVLLIAHATSQLLEGGCSPHLALTTSYFRTVIHKITSTAQAREKRASQWCRDIPNQTKPIVVCLCVRGVRTACIMCCMHTCSSLCMQFHSHPQTHHLERPQKLEHCPATQRLHSSQKRRYHYCSSVSLRICQMLQLCQLNTAADLIRQVQCNNKCNQVQGATKVAPLSSRCHEFQPLHMNRLH